MREKSIFIKVSLLAFVPSLLMMLLYISLGNLQDKIPSILLFLVCGMMLLFPFQLYMIAKNKSDICSKSKLKWWQLVLLVGVLFGFAGLMVIFITPLEHSLLTNVMDKINSMTPTYFSWDASNLANYSHTMTIITCIIYFILNVIIFPMIEEFYFRGVLTNKLKQYGYLAPIFVTIVFSLYHFWLPFDILFRIAAFILPAILTYHYKDIRISIGFHCACNLFSTISFLISVF